MQLSTSWSRARVTLALTFATTAVWVVLGLLIMNQESIVWGGFVPARLYFPGDGIAPFWLTPLTAAFLHFNFVHLAFNLLILVFCGRPTEAVLGPIGFAILYVVGAYAAAAVHYVIDPSSMVWMVGAGLILAWGIFAAGLLQLVLLLDGARRNDMLLRLGRPRMTEILRCSRPARGSPHPRPEIP